MSTQNYAPQNGSHRPPRPPKFTPQIGVPYTIALAAVPGRLVPSMGGDNVDEVAFDLYDGRPWYAAQNVANAIYALRIVAGQEFMVVQTGKAKATIQVSLIGAGAATPIATPAIAQTTASPSQGANYNGNGNATPPPAPPAAPTLAATNQLMGCFMQAIDAIQEAQLYANRKGLGITFSSEDVRATAISCWIQCGKAGAR